MEMAQDLPDLPIGMLTDLHLKRGYNFSACVCVHVAASSLSSVIQIFRGGNASSDATRCRIDSRVWPRS